MVVDGEIVAGVAEERTSRRRHTGDFSPAGLPALAGGVAVNTTANARGGLSR